MGAFGIAADHRFLRRTRAALVAVWKATGARVSKRSNPAPERQQPAGPLRNQMTSDAEKASAALQDHADNLLRQVVQDLDDHLDRRIAEMINAAEHDRGETRPRAGDGDFVSSCTCAILKRLIQREAMEDYYPAAAYLRETSVEQAEIGTEYNDRAGAEYLDPDTAYVNERLAEINAAEQRRIQRDITQDGQRPKRGPAPRKGRDGPPGPGLER